MGGAPNLETQSHRSSSWAAPSDYLFQAIRMYPASARYGDDHLLR
jgi:hypothetical protein